MGRFNYDEVKLDANKWLVLNEIQRRVKKKYPDVKVNEHVLEFPGAIVSLSIEQWGNSETVSVCASQLDDRIRQKKNGDFDYNKLMEQIENRRIAIIQRDMRIKQEAIKKKEMSEVLAHLGFKHDSIYFENGSISLMPNGTVKLEMNLTTPSEVETILKTILKTIKQNKDQ